MNAKQIIAKSGFKGEIEDNQDILEQYSHDASMFEIIPDLVVSPISSEDIQTLVRAVKDNKSSNPDLSLTARSGGTDMAGGAINDSIIVDFTKHLSKIGQISANSGNTQPGVYYRDFEKATLKHGLLMPAYPASKDLCTVGGIVANNAGGEKSLEFGKTDKFIHELRVVFADGNEYRVKALNKQELDKKIAQNDYEGNIYKNVYNLVENNYDAIKKAKPNVSKNSMGYNLWNVWDRETEVFDLTQLIVGSEGTLGFVTDISFKLVKAPKHSGTLVMFLRDIGDLGQLIKDVMTHKPATFEGFDNYTLMLSVKLFFFFHKRLGWVETIRLGLQLLPSALKLFRGLPKMVLLIEFAGDSPEDIAKKVHQMRLDLQKKGYGHESVFEEDETEMKEKKFWIMRRESFSLLRQKVKDKHTAPFIDDLVVNPEHLPEFLPKLRVIIKKYGLLATVAGHMGDGNFHIIPLMKLEEPSERRKLLPCMQEVNELILSYGGSLSGEHNDGLVRGPWLKDQFGEEILKLFKETKDIFDPNHIFNPHKKANSTWEYSQKHIRASF
ncbi:hypothetical protein A3F37_00355 [Candidatus Saccharibacteria bacterium RIFCSPHIGHO2_12_FULL_41_12]|nr:MAG: hypothetical protein A3F37_00355 [Candidatus Saccharibacteria bacterium RIFCSPHIGHO2_12_FULL_41_12]